MKWVDNGRRMAERAKELFKFVDDMGTVFPDWDNGRGLGVVYGEDSFRKLTPEELLEEQQKENLDEDMNMGM